MEEIKCTEIKVFAVIVGLLFLLTVFMPLNAFAGDDVQMLKQQLEVMSQQMKAIQEKLKTLENRNTEKEGEIKEIDDRLSKAEIHTATDKISLGVELRTRGESIHYTDMRVAPSAVTAGLLALAPAPAGASKATLFEYLSKRS